MPNADEHVPDTLYIEIFYIDIIIIEKSLFSC